MKNANFAEIFSFLLKYYSISFFNLYRILILFGIMRIRIVMIWIRIVMIWVRIVIIWIRIIVVWVRIVVRVLTGITRRAVTVVSYSRITLIMITRRGMTWSGIHCRISWRHCMLLIRIVFSLRRHVIVLFVASLLIRIIFFQTSLTKFIRLPKESEKNIRKKKIQKPMTS